MTEKVVTVYINDIEVKVLENSTVLQACEKAGVKVPRFCYHEKLSIAGNCRMCLVEIKNAPKLQASCALPVMKDARVYTDSIAVRKAREGIMELLLINHPLDCPICDQGGECDLQDQAMYYGSDHGRFNEYKRATSDKNFGPLIKTIMTRCIHCTRCVRFASEIAGCPELGTIGRGNNMEISTFVRTSPIKEGLDEKNITKFTTAKTSSNVESLLESQSESVLDSELSGNLIDICPVGALTSLPYAFVARPWELKSVVSIDVSDTYCSDIKVDVRGQGPGSILRILPADNSWISDKTRFSYDGLKRQRLITPLQKSVSESKVTFTNKLWDDLFATSGIREVSSKLKLKVDSFVDLFNTKEVTFFLGDHLDLETIQLLTSYKKQRSDKVNFYFIRKDSSRFNNNNPVSLYTDYINDENTVPESFIDSDLLSFVNKDSFINEKQLERSDVCLLVGTNPRLESPVLNTALQKVAKRGIVALFGSNADKLPYPVKHLGHSMSSVLTFINSPSQKIDRLLNLSSNTRNKVILVSSNLLYRPDGKECLKQLTAFASKYGFDKVKVLYQSVTELNALYAGLTVSDIYNTTTFDKLKNSEVFVYYNLPNFVLSNPLIKASLSLSNSLRIYIGSHGNDITSQCDFILPTTAFTERNSSFITNSGKVKKTAVVTFPPGSALDDKKLFQQLLNK